jgi:hypothetical protein
VDVFDGERLTPISENSGFHFSRPWGELYEIGSSSALSAVPL